MKEWLLILLITHADGSSSRVPLGPFTTEVDCHRRADAESLVGVVRHGDRVVIGRCVEQ